MGVHGLWKLIDSSGKPIPLEALENRILAVDISIWLYQLVKGFQDNAGQSAAHIYLLGLFHRICKLLFYRIKPIFVFDGGVPALKRNTIAARQSNRAKANQMGEKLRLTLLQNLVKQEALGKALGEHVAIPKLFQPKQHDSLFSLPPLPASEEKDSDSDSEQDKFRGRYKDLQSIDITSEEFLSLPPDMRHDILTELKECRKQNSWAKIHLMPEVSDEFSDFQMRRLLKRRAIQVGIEKAEGEMGTRGFTISDLKTILSDQGVDLAQRIAADSSTRLLYNNKIKQIPSDVKPKSSSEREANPKKSEQLLKELSIMYEGDDSASGLDETISSSENDSFNDKSLTQSEILEIIKQENATKTMEEPHYEGEGSLTFQEPKHIKIEENELSVNSGAVEKDGGNNEEELEPGSFPQEGSSCYQLSSPSSPPTPRLQPPPISKLTPEVPDNESTSSDTNLNAIVCKTNSSDEDNAQKNANENKPEVSNISQVNKEGKYEQLINKECYENIPNSSMDSIQKITKSERSSSYTVQNDSNILVQHETKKEIELERVNEAEEPSEEPIKDPSDDSDDDFIEVINEDMEVEDPFENSDVPTDQLTETKLDSISKIIGNKPIEIVIDNKEELEDDLFADVFENVRPQTEDEDKISFDETELIELSNISKQSASISHSPEQIGSPKIVNSPSSDTKNDKSYSLKVASPVPQLSINEIIKMKKDLEEESSYLMKETGREERIGSTITEQIRVDAQELLKLFGIPYIIAPLEAEAQCAYLDLTGQTQGTITDDSDIWLFGGNNVYKNFFDQKKYVQQFKATDITRCLHISRDEMIMLALLSGSDYTVGLTGVGAVTALEVIAHYPKNQNQTSPYERLKRFAKEFKTKSIIGGIARKLKKATLSEGFPSNEVINAYLNPEVDQSGEPFSWSKPNVREIRRYARDKFGWDQTKTDKVLGPVMESLNKTQTQGTLHRFFEWDFDKIESTRSKRVEGAINLLKTPSLLTEEPSTSRPRPPIRGNPKYAEQNKELPIKSKTPAQIAREKAAKKFKELKKQGKICPKSKNK